LQSGIDNSVMLRRKRPDLFPDPAV